MTTPVILRKEYPSNGPILPKPCLVSALIGRIFGLLRDELQEYGGLIGLLNAQQQSILNRRPDSLLEINQSVQTQLEASQILHRKRTGYVLEFG